MLVLASLGFPHFQKALLLPTWCSQKRLCDSCTPMERPWSILAETTGTEIMFNHGMPSFVNRCGQTLCPRIVGEVTGNMNIGWCQGQCKRMNRYIDSSMLVIVSKSGNEEGVSWHLWFSTSWWCRPGQWWTSIIMWTTVCVLIICSSKWVVRTPY
jgi:hypothetical protein